LAKILPKRSSVRGSVPDITDLAAGEIAINSADAKLYVRGASNNIVTLATGNADSYTENTYSSGVLTGQSKYTSNGGYLLETKAFTYTSGNLTKVVVKYGDDSTILTQTIAYDGDGNVSSITKDYA
jgi:pyruvoyl-dependent arginine decarboxylase (PvlArgDC)